MAKITNKHAAKLPGNGGYVDAGPDLRRKAQPTPYLYDAPSNVPTSRDTRQMA
ncbi:MAG: hypothetical protein ACLRZZ_28560 [Enterocloster sp.]